MTLHLHESTREELALLTHVPAGRMSMRSSERQPTMRFVPSFEDEPSINHWSLVEILRNQTNGPDRAA